MPTASAVCGRFASDPALTVPAAGQHVGNVSVYLCVIVSELVLAEFIWFGASRRGATSVRDLIGGRWSSLKEILLDVAVAAGLWLVRTAVATFMSFIMGP